MSPRTSLRTNTAAAVLTYIGAGFLLLAGMTFVLGTGEGTFFGQPTAEISLAGVPVALSAARAVGGLLIGIALALVALGVLTQRGHRAGRPGLTVVGVPVIGWLLYAALTHDPISPLVPAAWIVLTLVRLWAGRNPAAHA